MVTNNRHTIILILVLSTASKKYDYHFPLDCFKYFLHFVLANNVMAKTIFHIYKLYTARLVGFN